MTVLLEVLVMVWNNLWKEAACIVTTKMSRKLGMSAVINWGARGEYWNVGLNNVNFRESTVIFRVTAHRTAFEKKKTYLSPTRFLYINKLFHKLTLRCN